MMVKYTFPEDRRFAFTIFDDTDNATVQNLQPVYDLLYSLGLRTTKSVWPLKSKADSLFRGQSLQDESYLQFILDLKQRGFEIALHGVGSGFYSRAEIAQGLEEYKKKLGGYPLIHANHAHNPDNLYWGYKRFSFPFNLPYLAFKGSKFAGEVEGSPCFWGDLHKQYIKYTRSHSFNGLNTLKYDPLMPYQERKKLKYSNFWFSSSNAADVRQFNRLVHPVSIDCLEAENGVCIIYTHFAKGFVNAQHQLDSQFAGNLRYLAGKKGFFVPVSQLLDYLLAQRYDTSHAISCWQKWRLDYLYFYTRLFEK